MLEGIRDDNDKHNKSQSVRDIMMMCTCYSHLGNMDVRKSLLCTLTKNISVLFAFGNSYKR